MTMMAKRWNEGDWIDFIVRVGVPLFLITLGGITLGALVVIIKVTFGG